MSRRWWFQWWLAVQVASGGNEVDVTGGGAGDGSC